MGTSTPKSATTEASRSANTPRRGFSRMVKSLARNPSALIACIILLSLIVLAVVGPYVAPHDPLRQSLRARLKPPFWMAGGSMDYPLGTDQLGRDLLSRIIYGTRVSLSIGLAAAMMSGALGLFLGLLSGYFGGWVDTVIMRLVDIQMAFPFILLALILLAVLGPSLWNIIFVVVITNWVYFARVARGEVLALKHREFVEAARGAGASHGRIIFRHILPNLLSSMVVLTTLRIGNVILLESALAFLGLGITEVPTWGAILADGREYLNKHWWISTFPGLAIFLTVASANLLGDWVRDYTDVHLDN